MHKIVFKGLFFFWGRTPKTPTLFLNNILEGWEVTLTPAVGNVREGQFIKCNHFTNTKSHPKQTWQPCDYNFQQSGVIVKN